MDYEISWQYYFNIISEMFCHTIMAGGKLEVGTWHIVCTVCLLFNLYAYCTRPWCWERQDDMASWHHQLNGHEFEQTLGDNKGQGSLACCCPWVTKSWTWLSDWTTTSVNYLEGFISLGLSLFILRVSMLALTHLPTAHKEPCWSYRLHEARATSILVSIT